jgi:hypothetical protein
MRTVREPKLTTHARFANGEAGKIESIAAILPTSRHPRDTKDEIGLGETGTHATVTSRLRVRPNDRDHRTHCEKVKCIEVRFDHDDVTDGTVARP